MQVVAANGDDLHLGAGSANGTALLARLLRHEVGDLLQSVYSTTAILLERLPTELPLERRLLSDLKQRAEVCRYELDAVIDLVVQPKLGSAKLELGPMAQSILVQMRSRYSNLRMTWEGEAQGQVEADPRAMSTALTMMFLAVCQSAKKEVHAQIQAKEKVELTLRRDGFVVTAEQVAWLEKPFATTQQALFGLALALTARVVREAGGQITVHSPNEGGACVRIEFPVHAST